MKHLYWPRLMPGHIFTKSDGYGYGYGDGYGNGYGNNN
jgi:hypothetical protein